jgi:DNA-binding transcriptional LysR family regulator
MMKWDDRIGRRLKLHDLHVLLTVVEVGSMGKAAERLAISQPSISKSIAALERAVGFSLLDRTPRGVECTRYGRALVDRGMGAFGELRQGINDIASLADPNTGDIRVGCPEAVAVGFLSEVIDRSPSAFPASRSPSFRRTTCPTNFASCGREQWTSCWAAWSSHSVMTI